MVRVDLHEPDAQSAVEDVVHPVDVAVDERLAVGPGRPHPGHPEPVDEALGLVAAAQLRRPRRRAWTRGSARR